MLKGKIALVTGGSRGIGAAVVKKLASLGADIALVYAGNEAAANSVAAECAESYGVTVKCYRCNVPTFRRSSRPWPPSRPTSAPSTSW